MATVDAHCHIDQYADPASIAVACEVARTYTIAVTNLPSKFAATKRIVRGHRFMRAAAGLHPELVALRPHAVDELLPLLVDTKYVGEVGLDYAKADPAVRRLQCHVFERVLEQCETLGGRVITVHSRRAASGVLKLLSGVKRSKVILHWFSGSQAMIESAVSAGCFFSVNPAMTRSSSGRATIAAIPAERLLTESDGPFVRHEGRPVEPSDIARFLPVIAEIRGTTAAALKASIMNAFRDAVTLPDGLAEGSDTTRSAMARGQP